MALCKAFGALPSQVLDEDADIIRMIAIVNRGRREG